jgi:hypothetical protein
MADDSAYATLKQIGEFGRAHLVDVSPIRRAVHTRDTMQNESELTDPPYIQCCPCLQLSLRHYANAAPDERLQVSGVRAVLFERPA